MSRFEKGLWIVSVVVVTAAFLAMESKAPATLCASLVGVTALIFVAKGRASGQAMTIVFACLYGAISWKSRYYGEMITYLGMSAPMAAVALVNWLRHPYQDSAEVEVARMSRTQAVLMWVCTVLVTIAFYFILHALGNASLFMSTVSITTSFLASWLTAGRSHYYALAYAANDVVLIILWIMASVVRPGNAPMIACFAMFLVNDLYGFFNWRRMMRRQSQ